MPIPTDGATTLIASTVSALVIALIPDCAYSPRAVVVIDPAGPRRQAAERLGATPLAAEARSSDSAGGRSAGV